MNKASSQSTLCKAHYALPIQPERSNYWPPPSLKLLHLLCMASTCPMLQTFVLN